MTKKDSKRAPTTREKFLIITRDKSTCILCGRNVIDDNIKIHIDHIIPYSKGGKTSFNNLAVCCEECNLGKSNLILEESFFKKILDTVAERNENLEEIQERLKKNSEKIKDNEEEEVAFYTDEEINSFYNMEIEEPLSLSFRNQEELTAFGKDHPDLYSERENGDKIYIKDMPFHEYSGFYWENNSKVITDKKKFIDWKDEQMEYGQALKSYEYIKSLKKDEMECHISKDYIASVKIEHYHNYGGRYY